jgi:hypothetical protein
MREGLVGGPDRERRSEERCSETRDTVHERFLLIQSSHGQQAYWDELSFKERAAVLKPSIDAKSPRDDDNSCKRAQRDATHAVPAFIDARVVVVDDDQCVAGNCPYLERWPLLIRRRSPVRRG